MLEQRKKVFQHTKDKPDPGWFAVHSERVNWINCRDTFRSSFSAEVEGIYFSHNENELENVANFVDLFEDVLNLPDKSVFWPTNRYYACWIQPNDFWKKCSMRRSLFTILLRAGRLYQGDFEKVLYGHPYIQQTKLAVMRFLFGFTHFVAQSPPGYLGSGHPGWVKTFERKDETQIRQMLIEPPDNKRELCLVGVGSLWN